MAKLSLRREHFMYSYDEFNPQNLTFQMHHYYEILFFKRGNAKYIINGSEYSAHPGDVFITRPHELHSIVFTDDSLYERHFVQFDGDFFAPFSRSFSQRFDNAAKKHKIAAADAEKYGIDKFFYEIREYMTKKPMEYEVLMQSCIIRLAVAVCDCMRTSFELPYPSPKRTQKIKDYIDRNFTRTLSLDEIAERVYFNKYYMCHVFKEDTGITVKDYITLLRFMHARNLYAQGKSMTDISVLCGYSDYSLFYKSFTKYSGGLSPTEFFSRNTGDDTITL
ncbi:MAG: helix-turn-helix transcriptional regulator [Oscillospiraceae bacterium]|nr:helix-turn-helix transcriptional regulator [Oscillospiraceae bacterium]